MKIVEVKGNTYCIDTRMTYIPFYKINDNEIIMLDSGWAKGERKGIEEVLENNKYVVAHKGIYDDITKLINDNIDFYESRVMTIYELIDRPMTFECIMKVVLENLNIKVGSIYKYYTPYCCRSLKDFIRVILLMIRLTLRIASTE